MEHISIELSGRDVTDFQYYITSNFPNYDVSETLIKENPLMKPPPKKPSESFTDYVNKIPNYALEPGTYEIAVAGIGAISTVIGAIIGYYSRRAESKIVISGSSGRKIEVPSNTAKEDLEKYVEMAKELDNPKIQIQR